MPEIPEIHFASRFINRVCVNQTFGGKVEKSSVSKNPDIQWNCKSYKIKSKSRGKELMLTLTNLEQHVDARDEVPTLSLLFHFGMSGLFKMTPSNEIPKHAHLKFHTTNEKNPMTLSFVDTRRFGTWKVSSSWSTDRGPDPVFENKLFRENIVNNLQDTAFNKPICEVMLNQTFFNGIGNYLRAEILYRAKIMPFSEARTVLENLCMEVKQEQPDLLQLCRDVPLEVMDLGDGNEKGYDPNLSYKDNQGFISWLQCYMNSSMKKMNDHNKRTIWFSGKPGPLVPGTGSRKKKSKVVKQEVDPEENEVLVSDFEKPNPSKKTKIKKEIKHTQPDRKDVPCTRSRTKKMLP